MSDLAKRVEEALGPDRELDAAIWSKINSKPITPALVAPYYTASLDAAMMLVPDPGKWSVTAGHLDDWQAWVWLVDGSDPDWVLASTPALALCAAALRARAAIASEGPKNDR